MLQQEGLPPGPVEHRSGPSRRAWWLGAAAYLLVSLVALLRALPDPAGLVRPDGDVPQTTWFLAWWLHVLRTGSDPWVTDVVLVPTGVNLTWNTALPLPGVLVAPVTALFGPVAAGNVLLLVAFAGSMLAMRWCAGAVTRRPLTAWLAGLAYGCSPYLVAQAFGHLNLALVVVPPLLVRVLLELYTGRTGWRASAVRLALLSVVQFLVTEEVLVSVVVTAAAATPLVALHHRAALTRERVRDVALALGAAAVGAAVLLAWPLAVQLRGPGALSGPATEPVSFAADLLGAVVPSRNQLLHGSGAEGFAGNATENGSFLGPALVLLVVWCAWRYRGQVLDWALVAGVAFVLSLGGFLRVGGTPTAVKLPFLVVWKLPLLASLIPARFSLHVWTAVVLAVAAASDRWSLPRRLPGRVAAGALALAVAVPLVPAWPYAFAPADVPAWIATGAYRELPRGGVVDSWPVPRRHLGTPTSSPVDWQAEAGFWYRTTGGHVISRGPDGRGTQLGAVTAWERAAGSPCPGPVLEQQVRQEWTDLGVVAVLVDPTATGAPRVAALLQRVTGRGPDSDRLGMQVWRLDLHGPGQPRPAAACATGTS